MQSAISIYMHHNMLLAKCTGGPQEIGHCDMGQSCCKDCCSPGEAARLPEPVMVAARGGALTAWRSSDSRRPNWNLLPLYSSARSVSCSSGLLSLSRRCAIQG